MPMHRILVIEDERVAAKDVEGRLRLLGYSVPAVASAGAEALAKAAEIRPDLALVDIRLQGEMDGVEVAEQLRSRFRVPVIFLTAYADEGTIERAKKAEPFGYLLKPIEEKELQRTVELALYKHAMEVRLQESEQWLSATLRCIADGVIATDAAGSVRFMNPVAEALTGWDGRSALGRKLNDVLRLLNEATCMPIEDLGSQALVGSTMPPDRAVLVSRSGQVSPVSFTAAPIRDNAGVVIGLVAAIRDITESRRAEEALRKSEERYRTLFENANDLVFTSNLQGILLSVNKAAESLTGYSRSEAVKKSIFDFVAPDAHALVRECIDQLLGGAPSITAEVPIRSKDGRRSILEVNTTLRFDAGRPESLHSIARDVTERKRTEKVLADQAKELARSNAELEQFAYVASHDLQEPLRMVSSYVQLLAQRYRGKLDADADDFIAFALDGAARMQQLIRDLLAYSRVSTRGRTPGPVDSGEALAYALGNLAASIEESAAMVTYDELPVVCGDSPQLSQLFQNLLGNALKFRGAGRPRVHVSAERNGAEWVFSVRDNGIGFGPEYRERIFNMFERGASSRSYPGTGIGLAICKRIVERHGGRIWAESEPGAGSVFCFTMPDGRAGDGDLERVAARSTNG